MHDYFVHSSISPWLGCPLHVFWTSLICCWCALSHAHSTLLAWHLPLRNYINYCMTMICCKLYLLWVECLMVFFIERNAITPLQMSLKYGLLQFLKFVYLLWLQCKLAFCRDKQWVLKGGACVMTAVWFTATLLLLKTSNLFWKLGDCPCGWVQIGLTRCLLVRLEEV